VTAPSVPARPSPVRPLPKRETPTVPTVSVVDPGVAPVAVPSPAVTAPAGETSPRSAGRADRSLDRVATALPILLGAGVFAVSSWHVYALARWAGQPAWACLLIASTGELMAIAALLEIRYRQIHGGSKLWPIVVLLSAVAFSAACNLAATTIPHPATPAPTTGHGTGATHPAAMAAGHGPNGWTPVMALWPVVAFALVAGMKATRRHGTPTVAHPPATGATGTRATGTRATAGTGSGATGTPGRHGGTGATRRPTRGGTSATRKGRSELARLVAALPADDPRSGRQLAADLAPAAGLSISTARRYLAEIRRGGS